MLSELLVSSTSPAPVMRRHSDRTPSVGRTPSGCDGLVTRAANSATYAGSVDETSTVSTTVIECQDERGSLPGTCPTSLTDACQVSAIPISTKPTAAKTAPIARSTHRVSVMFSGSRSLKPTFQTIVSTISCGTTSA